MKIDITYDEFCEWLCLNIKELIHCHNMTQDELVKKCESKGYKISQPTISNIMSNKYNKISLRTLFTICKILNIPMSKLIYAAENKNTFSNESLTTINKNWNFYHPSEDAYNGWLGKYNVYCFPTNKEKNLLHGILELQLPDPSKYNRRACIAKLKLYTGVFNPQSQCEEYKEYKGHAVASKKINALYCRLENSKIGEICYLNFYHWHFNSNSNQLACEMAVVITTSSGNSHLPTAQRFFLCRKELTMEEQEILMGHLRLNKADMLISEQEFTDFIKNDNISEEFKLRLKEKASRELYYSVEESELMINHKEDISFIKALSLLRNHTKSPTNNKISQSTNKYLYKLFNSDVNYNTSHQHDND